LYDQRASYIKPGAINPFKARRNLRRSIMKKRHVVVLSMMVGLGVYWWPVTQVNGDAGGIPSLAGRVSTLETNMTTQQTTTMTLDQRVETLEAEVNSLQNDVVTLQNTGPKFAVVDHDGTIRARSGVQQVKHTDDTSGDVTTGFYRVYFDRDVSKCAATVTAEPGGSTGIIASINGTFRGIEDAAHPKTLISVVLSDAGNTRVDSRFNIIVVC